MHGSDGPSSSLLSYIDLEARVRADHVSKTGKRRKTVIDGRTLPRLGSGVRFASPAPGFSIKLKSYRAGIFPY